ncbi:MAG: peptidase M20, partial [Bacteroidota bacterium]
MDYINNYIEENKERFLEELFGLIRIPSISSIKDHKPDMYKAAEYWKNILLEAGADKAEVYETKGNPVT